MALAIAVPALADDFAPFEHRYEPGSMYMEWKYNEDAPHSGGDDRWDGHDVGSFVPHPEKEDPGNWQGGWEEWGYEFINGEPMDPCNPDTSYEGIYGAQMWAYGSGYEDPLDPCNWIDTAPIWLPTFEGRSGVMADFAYGSWDLYNFVHDQPAKDVWVQLTYWNIDAPGTPVEFEGDPCEGYWIGTGGGTWGEGIEYWGYEGPLAEYGGEEWWETWEQPVDPCDPCGPTEVWCYADGWLDDWDPCWGEPMFTWLEAEGWEEGDFSQVTVLPDGWIQQVISMTLPDNPDFEWFEFGVLSPIVIDQIIIETLCYVPEPTTMVLLGVGSLLMIRRKRR